jgi:hypothetical protein
MVRLPAFQPTPATRRTLLDIALAARCRLALGLDGRTHDVRVALRAEDGHVLATYSPWLSKRAEVVREVLRGVEGVRSCTCTAATTNVAYVEERFPPDDEALRQVVDISSRWNAAVHVICFEAGGGGARGAENGRAAADATAPPVEQNHGGILSDTPDCEPARPDGVAETMDRLVRAGLAGGFSHVCGGTRELGDRLGASEKFSLLVVGNVYASKGTAVQKRMKRDLLGFLSDRFQSPVIGTEDLKARYISAPSRWLWLGVYAVLTAAIYLGVFSYERPLLELLRTPGVSARLVAAAAIAVFVPLAAYCIGGLMHGLLSLLKFE